MQRVCTSAPAAAATTTMGSGHRNLRGLVKVPVRAPRAHLDRGGFTIGIIWTAGYLGISEERHELPTHTVGSRHASICFHLELTPRAVPRHGGTLCLRLRRSPPL